MARALDFAVRALALAGGLALLGLIAMVGLSALGSAAQKLSHAAWLGEAVAGVLAGLGPIKASFELIEASLPMIVFAALPLVQHNHAHARVDFLAERLPHPVRRVLAIAWPALTALLMALIAWRLGAGMLGKMRSGTTTFLLGWPLWWFYAACLPGAWLTALVAGAQTGAALARPERSAQ